MAEKATEQSPRLVVNEATGPPAPTANPDDFFAYVKKKGKPALAALIGNAFRIKCEGANISFFFDQGHGNLIPMLRAGQYSGLLKELATEFFGRVNDLHFLIGKDPKVQRKREKEAESLEKVKANPKVRFILEQFQGTILDCKVLDTREDDHNDGP